MKKWATVGHRVGHEKHDEKGLFFIMAHMAHKITHIYIYGVHTQHTRVLYTINLYIDMGAKKVGQLGHRHSFAQYEGILRGPLTGPLAKNDGPNGPQIISMGAKQWDKLINLRQI